MRNQADVQFGDPCGHERQQCEEELTLMSLLRDVTA